MTGLLKVFLRMSGDRKNRLLFMGDGGDRFQSLQAYSDGYRMCMKVHGVPADGAYDGFDSFVRKAYEEPKRESPHSLFSLIASRTAGEQEAFEAFFALLQEYCEIHSIRLD